MSACTVAISVGFSLLKSEGRPASVLSAAVAVVAAALAILAPARRGAVAVAVVAAAVTVTWRRLRGDRNRWRVESYARLRG